MIVNEIREIVSCEDFELGIKRENLLKYNVTYPSDKKVLAIVFVIPGFGEDTNSDYLEKMRHYVANEFSVAVVNVFYHCFYSRLNNGASLEFDDSDIPFLENSIVKHNIDFSDIKDITRDIILDKFISTNKEIIIPMTLVPKNNEYQNFGVMQAIDHLNVLLDLKKNIKLLKSVEKTICFGSSHGGYISNMMSKIAPNVIDYIVDNSSYVKPPLQYIVGKEKDVNFPEFIVTSNKLKIYCFVKTHWSMDKKSKYYFSSDRYRIRNIGDEEHLKLMSEFSKNKTKYIFYHSKHDAIASIEDKIDFVDNLHDCGYEIKLNIYKEENEVDGKFIKNLQHGMGMSIKELINRELPTILSSEFESENSFNNMKYICDNSTYSFDVSNSLYKCEKN